MLDYVKVIVFMVGVCVGIVGCAPFVKQPAYDWGGLAKGVGHVESK